MLSSRSFIVLCLTFRSLVHFELIFVKVYGLWVNSLSFLHVDVQLYQDNLLKRQSLLQCVVFAPLSMMS